VSAATRQLSAAHPPASALFERAQRYIAGGVDSPVRAGAPMGAAPPVIARAAGSRIYDASGREYIDYLCAYGPVLLGHAHSGVTKAVHRTLEDGAVFGATHPQEVRLAERIIGHMPALERVRFVNTGTEACMSAIRLARAFTQREKIVRFAGNYHGHSDEMIFSAGASSNSAPTLSSGVTCAVRSDVVVLPYNDLAAAEAALREQPVAAVILEPVVGNMGLVMPRDGYLAGLRKACSQYATLLVFDEVITGFRLGLGGAQAHYGVRPDLTCIGKTLGGGLPIAAFGGRAEIMAHLAPEGNVFQGGTFSGNPVCIAAAHAFLDALESEACFHDRLDSLAQRLAHGAREAIAGAGLSYPVVQLASMVDFAFRPGAPPRDYAQASEADGDAYARYYWKMLERGIFLPPSKMEVMFLTGAHTEADIDRTIVAMRETLSPNQERVARISTDLSS
jgi:glutamate-1-semialdehyde 2,1-aminomutase